MVRRTARSGPARSLLAALAWTVLLLLSSVPGALAAGPPFDDRPSGASSHLVDDAGVIPRQTETALAGALQALKDSTGVDLVAYLQVKPSARTPEQVAEDAQALLDTWVVGGPEGDGAVLMIDFDRAKETAIARIVAGPALTARVEQSALDAIVSETVDPSLASGDWLSALTQGLVALSSRIGTASPPTPEPGSVTPRPVVTPRPQGTTAPEPTPRPTIGPGSVPDIGPAPLPGPPWPVPLDGVRVYDYAGVLEDTTIVELSETIARIEDRTGAQVAIYTQVKPESDTFGDAEQDAISLMDTWGIGQRGIDDGLVILVDLAEDRCHGQIQLYGGPGYRASYLTDADRERLFQEVMLPDLRACDFDSALLAAMAVIDANATPERARGLALARQVDAATGLLLAPLLVVGLLSWAGWSWLRYGKDPRVVDDPSVLMPAPPPGLSPAAAAVVLDGRAKRHALTTAMVDLAARGELRFLEASGAEAGLMEIEILAPDETDPRIVRNRRMPTSPAEDWALERLQSIAGNAGRIKPESLLAFGKDVEGFEDRLERHVAEQGWFTEPPEDSTDRWTFRAAAVLVVGAVSGFLGWRLPSNGLLLLGFGLLVAAIGMFILARAMPQRTMQGAMVNAWLSAYRRTLARTLEQSRTMDQVVASRAVPWLETADQAVVWGYAMGLHEEVEDVLARSVDVARAATGPSVYFPVWFVGSGAGSGPAGPGGGPSSIFSSSSLPDFGAMTAALATIGNSPSSSSSGSGGSGGGFGGGGSGGGGGGAGGGF
jgi:uncharacterized membrane protein YgcG